MNRFRSTSRLMRDALSNAVNSDPKTSSPSSLAYSSGFFPTRFAPEKAISVRASRCKREHPPKILWPVGPYWS